LVRLLTIIILSQWVQPNALYDYPERLGLEASQQVQAILHARLRLMLSLHFWQMRPDSRKTRCMRFRHSNSILSYCYVGLCNWSSLSHSTLKALSHHLIEKYGSRYPLDIGGLNVKVEAPVSRLVTGIKPETLGDLDDILTYTEEQITQVLAVGHTGQEGNNLDFESKAFHIGMVDHVGMEVGDIAQISVWAIQKLTLKLHS